MLRGPQGLFRGLTSPAGAITIATRKPSFTDTNGYMQGTATDRNGYNVQGGVSLAFSDKFAIRVAGLVDGNRGNGVTDVTRNERSRTRAQSMSPSSRASSLCGVQPSRRADQCRGIAKPVMPTSFIGSMLR